VHWPLLDSGIRPDGVLQRNGGSERLRSGGRTRSAFAGGVRAQLRDYQLGGFQGCVCDEMEGGLSGDDMGLARLADPPFCSSVSRLPGGAALVICRLRWDTMGGGVKNFYGRLSYHYGAPGSGCGHIPSGG